MKIKNKTKLEQSVEEFGQEIERLSLLKKKAEEEAWSRSHFIEHISDVLKGGLFEFYKSRLAEKNGEKFNVKGWLNEARRIVGAEFARNLIHSTKGISNYDKAYQEIVSEVFHNDHMARGWANSQVQKIFPDNKLIVHLDESDTTAYRALMDSTFSEVKKHGFKTTENVVKKKPKRNNNF